ncbi:MAG: SDR family NAD(P)-dependent oxidoreductase, partial [Terriglobia bacterium]
MSQQPLSSIKLALLARQLRSEKETIQHLLLEPIAVIGMGCRFPGGSNSPDAFWELLANGRDGICQVPSARWDIDAFYDPAQNSPGKMNTRWGGFLLEPVDLFDAEYFGISPREARCMDPQQRLMLEVAIEAFDAAGQSRDSLNDSQTGIFVASYHNDYSLRQFADKSQIEAYTIIGSQHSVSSNRLSFLLNLHGPSLTLDTACSSSLVAVHLACQSLRLGECQMALAAGVSLMLAPEVTIALSKGGFMAPDGHCKTFDARADGFVRGEGCGAVVLKRLADALADDDPILAVIRGSSVNQDGRSNGFTAPNGLAQEELIRQALQNSGVTATQISYVETHGTGTPLGDPIEVEALSQVLGPHDDTNPCYLGALKSNVGHLEAAAGIAGLIKVLLCLQYKAIPPNLHFSELNPHISLKDTRFQIPTRKTPWTDDINRRFAAVSSFGVGGTNAHVVLEEAPHLPDKTGGSHPPYLLLISAHNENALQDRAREMKRVLQNESTQTSLWDFCWTSAARTTTYDHRLAVVEGSRDGLAEQLDAYLNGETRQGLFYGRRRQPDRPKLAFVFSGQGPQWWGMGRELLSEEPVFRKKLEECDRELKKYVTWSLLGELTAGEQNSRLDQTEIAQPALYAIHVALAALWQSWGIEPHAVVGHSVGELAAAHIAGALSFEDALRIVYHRGRLMQQATGSGKMAEVELPHSELKSLLSTYEKRLSIAAINSPTTTVLSGETAAIDSVLKQLTERNVAYRRLPVDYAFHSHQMEPFEAALAKSLEGISPRQNLRPMVSTVSGAFIQGENLTAEYWGWNVRQPVRFSDAVGTLAEQGYEIFVEIGPHPVLSRQMEETLSLRNCKPVLLPSLRRQRPERATLLGSLGTLWICGIMGNWEALFPDHGRPVRLPSYSWQRQSYWIEQTAQPMTRSQHSRGSETRLVHPLLGSRLQSPAIQDVVFEARVGPEQPSFLKDHLIFGSVILPGTAILEMAVAAGGLLPGHAPKDPIIIKDLLIQKALLLPTGEMSQVQMILNAKGDQADFRLFGRREDEEWTLHASGIIASDKATISLPANLQEMRVKCNREISREDFYLHQRSQSIEFGPAFQGLERLWRSIDGDEALARVSLPDHLSQELQTYHFHPALLDACLQPCSALLSNDGKTYLPIGLENFHFYSRPFRSLWSHVRLSHDTKLGSATVHAQIQVMDDEGRPVAEVRGLHLKQTDRANLLKTGHRTNSEILYEIRWEETNRPETTRVGAGNWLILADQQGIAEKLAEKMQKQGERCTLVFANDLLEKTGLESASAFDLDVFRRFLCEATQDFQVTYEGVIHLWSLDIHTSESMTAGEWIQAQRLSCSPLLHLIQVLNEKKLTLATCCIVTRGSQPVGVDTVVFGQWPTWGLGRTLRLELPEMRCVQVDLDSAPDSQEIDLLWQELHSVDGEDQVAFRRGIRLSARLEGYKHRTKSVRAGLEIPEGLPYRLDIAKRGVLDDLELRPVPRRGPGVGEVEIRVHATGLNFRDVLNVLGMYPGAIGAPGSECSGTVVEVGDGVTNFHPGQAVLALAEESFSSHVLAKSALTFPKPATLSFEDGAGVLIPFLTAYYSLDRLAKMKPGERVLIHAAAGGVGLAAVQLACWAGAEVFATAGSQEKRDFLRSTGVHHVMNSRTLEFATEILEKTGGRGVDIVLNSLNGEFVEKSVSVLAPQGRFLEIGKLGIWTKEQMTQVRPDVDYHVVYLGEVYETVPDQVQSMVRELLAAMEKGELKPLPKRVFPIGQTVDAFRFMAQAKHIGKILVTQEAQIAHGSVKFHADASYLITGGWGGLGIETARWMAQRGAKQIALLGRSAPGVSATEAIRELEESGVNILVIRADVSRREDIERALNEIRSTKLPLKGIVHAAGILDDGILLRQNWSRFENVMAPKIAGSWNLHWLTRHENLDFFIMFSSMASIVGSRGQGNYAAANAFLDGLANFRRGQGLEALSVNWGAWSEIGMASALGDHDQKRWSQLGMTALTTDIGFQALESALSNRLSQVGVMAIEWSRYLDQFGTKVPRFLSHLVPQLAREPNAPSTMAALPDLVQRLEAVPLSKRKTLLESHVREQVLRVLGLPLSHMLD